MNRRTTRVGHRSILSRSGSLLRVPHARRIRPLDSASDNTDKMRRDLSSNPAWTSIREISPWFLSPFSSTSLEEHKSLKGRGRGWGIRYTRRRTNPFPRDGETCLTTPWLDFDRLQSGVIDGQVQGEGF